MRENFKIVTNQFLRDSRLERRIVEYNRERIAMMMILAGCVLLVVGIIW